MTFLSQHFDNICQSFDCARQRNNMQTEALVVRYMGKRLVICKLTFVHRRIRVWSIGGMKVTGKQEYWQKNLQQ